jgi:Tfp pilus assembly protein PilO
VDNQRAPIFAAAGVVVVAILLVFFLVLPKMAQVSRAKDDLAAAAAQQQTLEAQKGALEDLQAKAGENKAIIKDVNEKIPPTAEESGLLLLLNNAAIDSGLDLASMAPAQPAFDQTTGLSTIAVAMSATGTYNEVTTFAYKIETLPRAAKIISIQLTGGDSADSLGNPILTATIQLNAYTSDASAGPGSTPGPTEAVG